MASVAAASVVALLSAGEIIAAFTDTRTISLYNIHSKDTISVEYKKDGKYVPAAMERVNWALRDWRRDEPAKMDPALIDLLWEIHEELGSKEPIHIISGYRSRATNDMLRRTVGGQASESRHILGKAADVFFPDIPLKKLRYSALIRERGGVGYYPTSALPFVHIDTDRVRHWPRLPRFELALLFPNGKSQHHPADGGDITADDVRVAQSRHKDLAVQIASQLEERQIALNGKPRPNVALADAGSARSSGAKQPNQQVASLIDQTPPAIRPTATAAARVQSAEPPALIDAPSRLATRPSTSERAKLAQLAGLAAQPIAASSQPEPRLVSAPAPAVRPKAQGSPFGPSLALAPAATSFTPKTAELATSIPGPRVAALDPQATAEIAALAAGRAGWSNGFSAAPAFDEEHPDELSYRPFPIAPLLTQTASADDPALAKLIHPDAAKTLELLDSAGSMPPMRLRPGIKTAELMMAQQFSGEAANFSSFNEASGPTRAAPLAARKVQTSGQ